MWWVKVHLQQRVHHGLHEVGVLPYRLVRRLLIFCAFCCHSASSFSTGSVALRPEPSSSLASSAWSGSALARRATRSVTWRGSWGWL
jgi:hypothetical protein